MHNHGCLEHNKGSVAVQCLFIPRPIIPDCGKPCRNNNGAIVFIYGKNPSELEEYSNVDRPIETGWKEPVARKTTHLSGINVALQMSLAKGNRYFCKF